MGPPYLEILAWHSFGAGFLPWQPLSVLLTASTDLGNMLGHWLILLLTVEPVLRLVGRRQTLKVLGLGYVLSTFLVLGLDALHIVQPSVMSGPGSLITGLLTLFCLSLPDATIRLFFVLPVRASWLVWGTGLLQVYYSAAYRDISSFHSLGVWAFAVWMIWGNDGGIRRLKLLWQRRQVERKLSKFSVIEGGKSRNDWVN